MSFVKTVKIKDGDDFRVINETDFDPQIHELCDGEELSGSHKITVQLSTETAPELQKAIDEAKAECEKVVAESNELKEQLNKEREAVKKLTAEKDDLLTQVKDLEAKLKKQAATEAKAAKAAETKAEQPKE